MCEYICMHNTREMIDAHGGAGDIMRHPGTAALLVGHIRLEQPLVLGLTPFPRPIHPPRIRLPLGSAALDRIVRIDLPGCNGCLAFDRGQGGGGSGSAEGLLAFG